MNLIPVNTSSWLKSPYFKSQNIGWIGTDSGYILRTNNGGVNWIKQTTTFIGTKTWLSPSFIDYNTGWCAGKKFNRWVLYWVNF